MRGKGEIHRLRVGEQDAGQRLDQVLAARLSGFSRTYSRRIIDLGGVHVDGRRTCRCSLQVREGQGIEVHLDGLPLEPFSVTERHIVFQDRYLLAIDKPAGIDTQPTHARYKGTLYEALLRYLHDPFRPQCRPELGMVQRLDRNTSGIMVFSIHPQAHKPLTQAMAARDIEKIYWALVQGVPSQRCGEIRTLLARGRRNNLVKSVPQGGREALTHYRVLHAWEDAALLEVRIPTGRSHQIRAHLAELGHPLLGDAAYGGCASLGDFCVSRHMLHSLHLALRHPVTNAPLQLSAPLPQDMLALLQHLGMPPDNLFSFPPKEPESC
ncbi:RluA family pseudouridine synthase [Geoalkalibacter halelectricus]|uniref:Pseudouridine synthase n=1 Tax=Geoalkalibacter halelectricus TaxID=2847045 RepID=A0ABY5ZJ95_9BACT|nr:RluA family pseudouridine synthase [Geoalkalibacter halelectricus]MDO3379441.1 RluA family pseudouridine synthase [Geoalkalibacter halelectricus]UWZ78683.1 RluA family pseudouridine synthase [Geoalkalibacter halelectricus]